MDALYVLGWLLDPGSPPFDCGNFVGWHVRFNDQCWASAGLGLRLCHQMGVGWDQYVVPVKLDVTLDADGHFVRPIYVGGLALCVESDPPALLCLSSKLRVGSIIYYNPSPPLMEFG